MYRTKPFRAFSFSATLKRTISTDVPQFTISSKNGFLPRQEPLEKLPEKFSILEDLLRRMPVYKNAYGLKGLLYHGKFAEESAKVPEYDLEGCLDDSRLVLALFRDYTFWASAYLLEPCDMRWRQEGFYGLGRDTLPRNIAVPLVKLAEKLEAKPFMEYALSYALSNWARIDKGEANGMGIDNLKVIRSFSGLESEAGFILIHVAMVAETPKLVEPAFSILSSFQTQNRPDFDQSLRQYAQIMHKINAHMEGMWAASKHSEYQLFRTFIMGLKNQPMFPHGVIYEGVSPTPRSFRGESGANDSIIPTADNLFELYDRMPKNELTDILKDFRKYRPIGHQIFLRHVYDRAKGLKDYSLASPKSALLYLMNLDEVRDFRWRHWSFTKEYILQYSKHPVATGGSPIVTWLPNQLSTVLQVMQETIISIQPSIDELDMDDRVLLGEIADRVGSQTRQLQREVEKLGHSYPNATY